MNLGLTGQTAVVAGAAQGIGRAIAEGFAAEGANVALLDRAETVGDVARDVGQAHDVRTLGLVGDATDFGQLQADAEAILTAFERVDHLVYAVGTGSGKFGFPFWNLEPSDWAPLLQVNLLGAVNFAHAFTPELVRAKSGTMLFLSSVAGQIGSQTDPPYSAAKAALINFGQCAAKDLAPHGVRVNVLCPGMVKTTLNRSVWQAWNDRQPDEAKRDYEDWAGEKVRKVVPLGRWQTADDMAAMAVFLASERAANVTGQTVNVDGGFVMHW